MSTEPKLYVKASWKFINDDGEIFLDVDEVKLVKETNEIKSLWSNSKRRLEDGTEFVMPDFKFKDVYNYYFTITEGENKKKILINKAKDILENQYNTNSNFKTLVLKQYLVQEKRILE